jgi:SET domain-containing protein
MAVKGRRPRAYKPATKYEMNMMKLMEHFHSEEKCRQRLAELRWPNGVICPRCEGKKHAYDSKRYVYDCYSCGYQFTVIS